MRTAFVTWCRVAGLAPLPATGPRLRRISPHSRNGSARALARRAAAIAAQHPPARACLAHRRDRALLLLAAGLGRTALVGLERCPSMSAINKRMRWVTCVAPPILWADIDDDCIRILVLNLKAAVSASSALMTMRSVFSFSLSPTVNCIVPPIFTVFAKLHG
jgi:hypothetical protein